MLQFIDQSKQSVVGLQDCKVIILLAHRASAIKMILLSL
jgi:hypothetical protein